jgi:hypothetical protein
MREAKSLKANGKPFSLRDFVDLAGAEFFWLDPVEEPLKRNIRLSERWCPVMEVLGNRMILRGRHHDAAKHWVSRPEMLFVDLDLPPMAVEWINSYGYFIPYRP